jgi:hypothetical protein
MLRFRSLYELLLGDLSLPRAPVPDRIHERQEFIEFPVAECGLRDLFIKPRAIEKPDQANTATWTMAWTNLLNHAEQTFVPSLPRLTSIEVGLVVGNPGPPMKTSH